MSDAVSPLERRARFKNSQGVFNNPSAARILKDVQLAHAAQRDKNKRRYSSRPSVVAADTVFEQLDPEAGAGQPSV